MKGVCVILHEQTWYLADKFSGPKIRDDPNTIIITPETIRGRHSITTTTTTDRFLLGVAQTRLSVQTTFGPRIFLLFVECTTIIYIYRLAFRGQTLLCVILMSTATTGTGY